MADDSFSLHIDTDWKKQAQEEKKRLAEEQAARAAAKTAPTPATVGPTATTAPTEPGRRAGASRGQREVPPASFATLVQTALTQALFYLGELGQQGGGEGVNLDMAKLQIDTLGVLEDKTKGNLTGDETRLLDAALYETRMRFVSVASQYL